MCFLAVKQGFSTHSFFPIGPSLSRGPPDPPQVFLLDFPFRAEARFGPGLDRWPFSFWRSISLPPDSAVLMSALEQRIALFLPTEVLPGFFLPPLW